MTLPQDILAATALWLVAAVTVLWLISLARRDASIVDIFWGLGFILTGWTAYALGPARHLWPPLLTTVWGLRLAGYLAWRNLGHGEDYRYQAMRRRLGRRFPLLSYPIVFLLQGALIWIVSLPLQLVQRAPGGGCGAGCAAAMVLFTVGLLFESVGDLQLARFKADPNNRGRVMDRGLWRYTRHPNYFGDFVVWWAQWALSISLGAPLWTAVGPLVMSVLLLRVSGVTLLEAALRARRPAYEDYIRRTSAFFPWPPKD